LGGRASARFNAAHGVFPLDLRQASPESSGCLEHLDVKFSDKTTRRLSESEKIAQRH
jgi:hypothetical protein